MTRDVLSFCCVYVLCVYVLQNCRNVMSFGLMVSFQ